MQPSRYSYYEGVHAKLFLMHCRLGSLLLAAFSLCIVLAEATISGALPNLSVFSRILHNTANHQFTTELLTFLFLCYPCLCAYYAIFKLGRFNFYLLVPGYASHAPSCCCFSQSQPLYNVASSYVSANLLCNACNASSPCCCCSSLKCLWCVLVAWLFM